MYEKRQRTHSYIGKNTVKSVEWNHLVAFAYPKKKIENKQQKVAHKNTNNSIDSQLWCRYHTPL